MCMSSIDMPRKPTSYRIDERILNALESVSREGNISVNRYLENLLFSHLKQVGKIPMGEVPLGDTRGSGKGEARGGRGKKKKSASSTDEQPIAEEGAGKPKKSQDSTTNNTSVNTDDEEVD